MSRVYVKIGDVFCIQLQSGRIRCFQYVADDLTQLNSQVICVFKREYESVETLSPEEIVRGDVDFYAHTVISVGVQLGSWTKLCNGPILAKPDVVFNTSEDIGNPDIETSKKWWVWRIDKDMKYVGELSPHFLDTEIGSVIPAPEIVKRVETGRYQFVYPKPARLAGSA